MHTTGIPDTVDYSASTIDGSGNIYVTTNTISATEKANVLTTKYNSSGVVQWEVEKDNTDENDYGSAIDVDGSGNVYVAAATWVDGTNKYDYLVIKYNSSGTQQWTATYNGPGNFYDIPTDIFVDGSGNVYVTGASYGSGTLSDYCTIKYNASGTQQWASRYDYSSDQDIAAIIKQAPSGRIVVVGASENAPGSYDFAMVKYNQNTGAQITSNRNSASGTGFDQVYGADVDASGNTYITGRASVVDEGYNMKTVKLDTSLAVVWTKNYDFAGLDDESHGVIVDLDNNVYITGWVTNENGSKSFETIKYNSSGTPQWHNEESALSGLDAYGIKLSSVVDGNIIVAGNIDNGASLDFLTVVYSPDGERLWLEQYDSPDKDDDMVNFVKADLDGAFYVGGKSYSISTSTNRLIKYSANSFIIPPDDDMHHPSAFKYFENKGQIIDSDENPRDDIKFYSHRSYPTLFFTDDNFSYVWSRIDTVEDDTIARIDQSFNNSNAGQLINRAVSQGGEYLNYFLPQCTEGAINVRNSDRLIAFEVYDYVDVEYYFDDNGLKYYLIIKPGYSEQSDPISILYDGAADVNILGSGKLEIVGLLGTVTFNVADAYQIDVDGDLITLGWDAEYVEIDDFEIGFDLGEYDNGLPLVIEIGMDHGPEGVLGTEEDWSTYYGNEGYNEYAWELQVDDVGRVFVVGLTNSLLFPNTTGSLIQEELAGEIDAFVICFDDSRLVDWCTYLGGLSTEQAWALDLFEDEILLTGYTGSSDFPIEPAGPTITGSTDVFLTKITPEGNDIIWSTFLGGNVSETGKDISYDSQGNFYVVGETTSSSDFIYAKADAYNQSSFGGDLDGFVAKFDIANELEWCTYFGGSNSDELLSVETTSDDNVLISGYTNTMLPATEDLDNPPCDVPLSDFYFPNCEMGGAYNQTPLVGPINFNDNVLVMFNDDSQLIWSTYFGGSENEALPLQKNCLAIDPNAPNTFVFVSWCGDNSDFPHTATGSEYSQTTSYMAATVSKFVNFDLVWSSAFGCDDNGNIGGGAVVFDKNHNFYISGHTQCDVPASFGFYCTEPDAGEFPICDPTDIFLQDISNSDVGTFEGYIAGFNANNELIWSTYYGGNKDEYIRSLAYDPITERLYGTGSTGSKFDFPILDPGGAYIQTEIGGLSSTQDAFVFGFDISAMPFVIVEVNDPTVSMELNVFPNPTDYYLIVKLPYYTTETQIKIIDVNGKVLENQVMTDDLYLDLTGWAAGVYVVQAEQNGQIISNKFIIQ